MNKQQSGLKLSFLGGVGEVGKNIMALEYNNEILIIDSGLAFPSDDMPGIDLVIPDFTYLANNKRKIKGILITHGHEDHIGALPYLLQELPGVPVFASKLAVALIENKLKEHRKLKVKPICVKPKQVLKLGSFQIEFVKVTHSISGALAFAITTPVGVYFHTGDFKLDYTPIDGEAMDLARLGEISRKGVLLLTADSTNAERPGFSMSERKVGSTLDALFVQNVKKRIIIATFASNVHRIQQILNICEKYGRKIIFTGRSMLNICETASKIGELNFNKDLIVDVNNIDKYNDEQICILCTGSQGEENSALTRMANGEFNRIEIGENDYVIFSSSAIPGNEREINNVINLLYSKGASIIYESLAEVHVSGHAYQEELKTLHTLLKPKFFIPVHGEYRHLRAHANLAKEMGMNDRNILIPELGDTITISKNAIKKSGVVPSGIKLVDGLDISEAGGVVQRDRMQLASEGVCIVTITISAKIAALTSKPDIYTRGFVYIKDNEDVIEEAKDLVLNQIIATNFKTQDWNSIKGAVKKTLQTFFFKRIKRKPMIIPLIIETK
ncbi:MAG: ribonuclease J [Clostridiales bacterium]|nr:ribonuclease J [Clostridiales bacterium]